MLFDPSSISKPFLSNDAKNKKVIYPPFTFFKNIFNVRELMYDVFLTSRNDINSKMNSKFCHGEKSDFLGQLTEKIRGCGVSFYIWTKKGTQGELDSKVILYHIFLQIL
jgi:hypothetical protein